MSQRPLPPGSSSQAQPFGRRASDRGFAEGKVWFGRRAGDLKAKVRHSLPFATQVAAQLAEAPSKAEAEPYLHARPLRAGLVKDFKA